MMTPTRRGFIGTGAAALGLAALTRPMPLLAAQPSDTDAYRRLGLAEPAFAIEPKLNLPDLQGTTHRLADHAGEIVLVSFWATWCPPCRKEMPGLARLARTMKPEGLSVLAVNVGDRDDKVAGFMDEIDSDGLTVLLDRERQMPGIWYLRGLPVTYVLGRDGKVALAAIGDRVWDAPEMMDVLRSI